jgi:acyl-CoA synthetase (AMP-forming)/AMP-acid ligase II
LIAHEILQIAQQTPTAESIIDSRRRWTYADLASSAESLAARLQNSGERRFGVWCNDVPALVATLVAADLLGVQAVLFSAGLTALQVTKSVAALGLDCVLTDSEMKDAELNGAVSFRRIELEQLKKSMIAVSTSEAKSSVVLFTSGTSNKPKPALHTWESLSAGITREEKYAGRRWLLAYDPTSFAGIQVWLQALLTGGCICVAPTNDYAAAVELLISERIEFASATPTFWRMLLHAASKEDLKNTALVQITLGGEAVDQVLLDELRKAFPNTRITHIYASTEMGSCFAVHDGLAGFPTSFLTDGTRPCQLRVSDSGELEIRSRRSMLGYLDNAAEGSNSKTDVGFEDKPWFATGDLVERRGDRFHFIGRKSETINIGGAKVYPLQVEECIRTVDGVDAVRVYGIPSSITGQLVCAEVQTGANVDREVLRRNILSQCRDRLARQQIPAMIKFNEHLAVSGSGKLLRNEVVHGS